MAASRRTVLQGLAALGGMGALPQAAHAQEIAEADMLPLLMALLSRRPGEALTALNLIANRGSTDMVSSIIFAWRFGTLPEAITNAVLSALTGVEGPESWFDWMLWQEAHPEIASHPAYYTFKRQVFLLIDPNFEVFLNPAHIGPDAMKIRFEEVTWGGVVKDGIPSLDNPTLINARAADYILDDDLVFGVSLNGDARAYPLRIMGWHEMFNDVIGGVPVALAYCTLCGAGILFDTQVDGREEPFIFGSSGFLYRSNKLMFDRQTHSLWNQFTGKPVSGELVDAGIELTQRPVVITEWRNWLATNPDTKILSLETGHARDYGAGVVYKDYFASDDLMFPAQLNDDALHQKDYVFGVQLAGGAKAWPLTAFDGGRVINDSVGFHNLVLIGDAGGRTVRAYDRGDLTFDGDLNAGGQGWQVTEDALIAEDGSKAPRVAGHVTYWFAWSGYLGGSAELYTE